MPPAIVLFLFAARRTAPLLRLGAKEASPPKKSRGTAYRGTTGSTGNSVSQDSTDCKENTGSIVCSKQLFKEALGHTYDEPKRWQLHNINEIMNTVVTGWKPFSNPRMFAGYGRQKGWERDASGNELPGNEDGFVELSEEECRQLELPSEWIA